MKIQRSRKKNNIAAVAAAVVVIAVITGIIIQRSHSDKTDTSPSYNTILPKGASIKTLGGWERVSPPDAEPVFAYTDNINDVSISVSEQPLPDSFKSDTESKVSDLAKSYSATNELSAGDTKVYIGTSAKGPQSVIFTKKKLLILIKSQAKIDNKAWTSYINSLD